MDTPINEITDLEVYKDLLLIADMHRHNRFDPIHFGTWITAGISLKQLMETKDFSDICITVSIDNTREQSYSVRYPIKKGTIKELDFILFDFRECFLQKYPISDHFKEGLNTRINKITDLQSYKELVELSDNFGSLDKELVDLALTKFEKPFSHYCRGGLDINDLDADVITFFFQSENKCLKRIHRLKENQEESIDDFLIRFKKEAINLIKSETKNKVEVKEEVVETDFDSIINSTLEHIKELVVVKGKEYRRNDNPYHNFHSGSDMSGKHPLEVLDGFLLKHEVSIKDITADKVKGIEISAKQVHEKINDNIVYLLIKKAMLLSK
jgi:hypothetical protein